MAYQSVVTVAYLSNETFLRRQTICRQWWREYPWKCTEQL